MRRLGRIAVSRWYTVLAGVLLSTIAAALVFTCVPMTYRSSGTLVVMPPPRTTVQNMNPLLQNDSKMNTTAAILTQTITGQLLAFQAGLVPGADTVTAKNAAPGDPTTANGSPFITVTAESRDALRSPAIIYWMTDLSREHLADLQRGLRVAKRNSLSLDTVAAPTPSAPVLVPPIRAATGTLVLGLLLTAAAAHRLDRAQLRRRADELALVVPLDGAGHQPELAPVASVADLGSHRDRKAG
jgi:hypothetical protein